MTKEEKNQIIICISVLLLIVIPCVIGLNINMLIGNWTKDKMVTISNDVKNAMEEYDVQKNHCVNVYKLDIHNNYEKYLDMNHDSLKNEVRRRAEKAVSISYDGLFEKHDSTKVLLVINDKYVKGVENKHEFYLYCEDLIIAESLTAIAKQITLESLVKY